MAYTVSELSRLSGVSPRTLRYYDSIGLLSPMGKTPGGYRLYGAREVDALQQILYYRELGMPLGDIKALLAAPSFDRLASLRGHLAALKQRKDRLERLIQSVKRTIRHEKGMESMQDKEKFEAFKQALLEKNEAAYGEEIRAKYGAPRVEESNARLMHMDQETYGRMQALGEELLLGLEEAVARGEDPAGDAGARLARLHRQWLGFTWAAYAPQAHLGLVGMYVSDPRFTAYYDRRLPGCAAFLQKAVTALVQAEKEKP